MNKDIIIGLIAVDALFLLSFPVQAQNLRIEGETRKCTAALRSAQTTIRKGRNITINKTSKRDISSIYNEHPENRPSGYVFGLSGSAAESVMNSGQLMATISNSIMKHCPQVSIVEFNLYRTDATVTFGYDGENRVKEFTECVSLLEARSNAKIAWGKIFCE